VVLNPAYNFGFMKLFSTWILLLFLGFYSHLPDSCCVMEKRSEKPSLDIACKKKASINPDKINLIDIV